MKCINYACLVLLLRLPTVSIAKPPDFTELDKLVAEELTERKTPGAVIAIVSGDRVVYQKAYGLANVQTAAPMPAEMLFRLGSTTKMLTAAALWCGALHKTSVGLLCPKRSVVLRRAPNKVVTGRAKRQPLV